MTIGYNHKFAKMSHKRSAPADDSNDFEFLGKLQRLTSADNSTGCQNCIDLKAYIDEKFEQLTDILQTQNAEIMKALGIPSSNSTRLSTSFLNNNNNSSSNNNNNGNTVKREVSLQQSLFSSTDIEYNDELSNERPPRLTLSSVISMFPLQTEEDLVNVEEAINAENKDLFVDAIKSIVQNHLKKHFHSLLGKELVLDFNLDGTHGKTRFREFKNFHNVLREVVSGDIDGPDADMCIRKAFQHAKKFYYKQISQQRSKIKLECNNSMSF